MGRGHTHGDAHDHHRQGHGHHHHGTGNQARLFWALLLTGGFMVAEIVGGLLSGSLALLADAGHMATDTAALALSWYALRAGSRPPTEVHSYGQHRFQVLAAFINGASLVGISVWIVIEAIQRLAEPVEVLGGTMLAVAALGLAVNIAAFLILHGGGQENLNIRGATLHVLGDLLGSVAALLAAGVILWTGWTPIDPILSVLVSLLILRSAWVLLGRSWHVLMEGTPDGLDLAALKRDLTGAVPGVTDIHHVHAWSLTPERPLVTMHANIEPGADHDDVLRQLQSLLRERFGIRHATIQVEREGCAGPSGC
ncbi:cation diffusion facilitator family transporter [Indioceanicola profundi]|uniref:cation diffusion facilitator family transporter n=1 Tax=Indioceanicola profundi TaxID=2220096 RepID=UPI000E6AC67D|nr:cation diffusion facilitator family transporter [Indioceanicola profundi]